jgi:hypothetical protein
MSDEALQFKTTLKFGSCAIYTGRWCVDESGVYQRVRVVERDEHGNVTRDEEVDTGLRLTFW